MNHKKLLLGAHMSIEGGFHRALERGVSIGCTVLQIFTKSNRQWHAKPISTEEADLFKKKQKEYNISTVVAHASYLINLASDKEATRNRAVGALVSELDRCQMLGIPFLVLHPGSHIKQGEEKGIELVAAGINEALQKSKSKTIILLETMAGQGSSLGTTFEQIALIKKGVLSSERIGVCLDTCHIFVAGYNLSSKESYDKIWNDFEKIIGLKHLKAIHVNDSKKECGSRIDRHDHIGKGKIGKKAFSFLMNDPKLFGIPKILETPKESLLEDKENMQELYNLISPTTKTFYSIK